MSDRQRIFLLILIMTLVAIGVAGITLFALYETAFDQQRKRLVDTAQSRARLIEAIARHEMLLRDEHKNIPGDVFNTTLSQIKDAHAHFRGFGETGEFVLAKREGDQIVFLLSHRHHDLEDPKPVPFSAELAEPMRRALSKKSGTIIGIDYRDAMVLAAYEPVEVLDWGIVAKIDLAEIRGPFIDAGLLAGSAGLVLIFLGTVWFRHTINPLIRQLEESEIRIRTILDNVVDGIIAIDEQGVVETFNPAAERIFGYKASEITGKPVEYLMPEPDRSQHDEYIQRYRTTGEAKIIGLGREVIGLRKDGTTFPLDLAVSEVFVGERRRFIGVIRDITERRQAEQERERLFTELEAKNAEMERFTYTVSHDLKSPLITIKGFLGLLAKDVAAGHAERIKKDTEQIHFAVEKMQSLLEELLELSRVGRLISPPQEVSLGELVREAVYLVSGQINDRGVRVEIAPDLPVITVDRPRLLEVLQNLIDNAVKFMGAQLEPRIEIGVRRENAENVYYVLDNGIGIDLRYHEKVFDLFDRLDHESEGTGIGLALVKRIIEVHGGRVWVESEGEGRGTAFCFTLPDNKDTAKHE